MPQETCPSLGSSLRCALVVEAISGAAFSVGKKDTCHEAELVLGRNAFSEPILQAHMGKVTKRFSLEEMKIHRRFMKEGKSSISLPKEKVTLLISNCPPDKLLLFFKTLVGKLARHRTQPEKQTTARERLFAAATEAPFTEISPLCEQDVQCVRVPPQTLPTTTPTGTKSIKRKREDNYDDKENVNPNGTKAVRRNIALVQTLTELTRQQYSVLEAISTGKNVFFTGSAGTGKSFLLKRALGSLPPEHTFATASTGIAASHISGMTLHSFAGIGSGKADLDRCVELASRSVVASQWRKCRHLIIDEISMVHGEYFAKLEAVARLIRKSEEPFGGIQLIICGDFFQLPPVDKASAKDDNKRKFAFQTSAWRRCIDKTIVLQEVKRQTDNVFINILQKIRQGYCPADVTSVLTETSRHRLNVNGLQATRLSTHNDDVDEINQHNLDNLPGDSRLFVAQDSDQALSKRLNDLCPAAREITLKIGAQVMLCKNINIKEGLVNGTRGVVVGFEKNAQGNPIIKLLDGKDRTIQPENLMFKWSGGITLTRRQLPIKLAWAVSIHKSQGMTLDLVEMSLSRTFEYGQAYVALSRARSLQGLRVLDFTPECVKAHPKGMTLDLVEMSLSRTFGYGQAYLALSRARSLQGLRVLDFTPECVKAHPKVREYYKSLNKRSMC